MWRQMYKYGPFALRSTNEVLGKPVHFGIQAGNIFMWCEVLGDTSVQQAAANPRYQVQIVGTGETYKGECFFSIVDEAGFVWHAVCKEIEYIYDESGFVIGSTDRVLQ